MRIAQDALACPSPPAGKGQGRGRWRALARALMLVLALTCLGPGAAGTASAATNPDEILDDPVLEARARDLAKELRCLVCQNQSIDDSDAELARDLRRIVREQLLAGKTDDEIIAFLTERYGDFVLLRPPVKPSTFGLWAGPFGVLLIGAVGLLVYLRRRPRDGASGAPELSSDEQRRLDALLGRSPAGKRARP